MSKREEWMKKTGRDAVFGDVAYARKDTNPKDAISTRKVQFSLVPAPVIGEISLGMLEGGCKYGAHNYRVAGVRASVYYNAAMGHLMDWWEGEDIDPDSQLSHVTKTLSTLTVLRDAMMNGLWNDDRPPRVEAGWKRRMHVKAGEIIDKYPDPIAPYTQKGLDDD